MGNVFKSVAKFLDNALSGGEVDVIVLEEKPLDAGAVGASVIGELVTGAAAEGAASDDNAGEADASGADCGLDNADGGEAASSDGDDASATLSNQAEAVNADGGDASDGTPPATLRNQAEAVNADAANASAETASMPSVQQMLGEGQVAVDAAELESLRVDAAKWKENATVLGNLKAWKEAGSKENVLQGAVDAADAVATTTKRVSAATQKAIDLKNKMAGN